MLCGQAGVGLHELHSLTAGKRMHGDVKPANMILTKGGTVKHIDLGSAMATEQIVTGKRLPQTGTLGYESPEQVQNYPAHPISQNTAPLVDSWSWGCSLYRLLTGSMPWSELRISDEGDRADYLLKADIGEIMRANRRFSAALRRLGGQEAKDLFRVILSALQPDVEKRASMRKLLSLPWFRPCRLAALKAAAEAEQQPCLPGVPVEVSLSAAGPGATYLELLQEWREMEGQ